MSTALRPVAPLELSTDPRFAGRVRRLARTALIALGVIWALATASLEAPPVVSAGLAAGWASMPVILLASVQRPRLRYALVLPSTLVGVPLLVISAAFLPSSPLAAAGWVLITAGVLLGSVLGLWFWFRLLPVPTALNDPFAPGRLGLIRAHIALIVVGIGLAATGLLPV